MSQQALKRQQAATDITKWLANVWRSTCHGADGPGCWRNGTAAISMDSDRLRPLSRDKRRTDVFFGQSALPPRNQHRKKLFVKGTVRSRRVFVGALGSSAAPSILRSKSTSRQRRPKISPPASRQTPRCGPRRKPSRLAILSASAAASNADTSSLTGIRPSFSTAGASSGIGVGRSHEIAHRHAALSATTTFQIVPGLGR